MSLYLNLLEPRPVRLTALAALASESQFAVGLSLRRSMTSLERMVGDIMIASCLSDIVSLMTRFKVPSRHGMAALRGGVGAVSAELTVKCKVHEVPFRRCPNGGSQHLRTARFQMDHQKAKSRVPILIPA